MGSRVLKFIDKYDIWPEIIILTLFTLIAISAGMVYVSYEFNQSYSDLSVFFQTHSHNTQEDMDAIATAYPAVYQKRLCASQTVKSEFCR